MNRDYAVLGRRRGVQEAPLPQPASQHHTCDQRSAWIYEYLFAKKDRANITARDLDDFRTLAKSYAALSDMMLVRLLADEDLVEICHGTDEPI